MPTNRPLWAIRGSNSVFFAPRRAMKIHLCVTSELLKSYISPYCELREFTARATCYSAQLALKRYKVFLCVECIDLKLFVTRKRYPHKRA